MDIYIQNIFGRKFMLIEWGLIKENKREEFLRVTL